MFKSMGWTLFDPENFKLQKLLTSLHNFVIIIKQDEYNI